MTRARLTLPPGKNPFLPPPCRACPWQELPEGSGDCRNFKKLLCRLAPAAILEEFFQAQGI
ncbi:MAG: hypothetical protein ACOZF2_10855 [Thermodesulfobacteriota bacterium]